ncbi:c-type cytochrome [Moraxella nasovis]|uniref:c-type cytochrome n=1 Tax=Moraxella nasovis TaxID=2904121 RepID=UPI001F61DCE2|nr:c-type cytochrome [Moraxella nasovis]UNU73666.1 c-type cytochrome [Moraxella nasovis]
MMTMKRFTALSIATLLAFSTITTYAQTETQADAAATPEVQADAAAADAQADASAEPAAPVAPSEPIPEDSEQVKKLIALYPNLVARIAPHGKVCFEGEECDINITVLAPAVEGQARDGESLYKAICSTCHDSGLIGAPKVGNAGDWGPRIAKGKATLYDHATNGFNAMPARGGADISDDEVKNAVDYMVGQSS